MARPHNLNALGPPLPPFSIVPVLTIDTASDAATLIESLYQAGIQAVEITLRTPTALQAIEHAKSKAPQVLIGAGTVIRPSQVGAAISCGSDFGLAPGLNCAVVETAIQSRFAFVPGVSTPSDIEASLQYGFRFLKVFPAEALGGEAYIRALAGPYRHVGVSFLPLGGITVSNFDTYLRSHLVKAVGGSWIAPRSYIRDHCWTEIHANARQAVALASAIREECE